MVSPPPSTVIAKNALTHYHSELQQALSMLEHGRANSPEAFSPAFRLPDSSPALEEFFSVSDIAVADLPTYRGRRLRLLDLMRNPGTHTTKTLASLIIVARAVRHIHTTGERIVIVTPSSANKATALRDAVCRAVTSGLVATDQLQITSIVPAVSTAKLWSSELSDTRLRQYNPLVTHESDQPAKVKELASVFIAEHAERLERKYGVRFWYTLDLDNYRAADMVRAFVERDFLPPSRTRVHVHSVSSAFGLLGHDLGHRWVADESGRELPQARYFLVQHLGTPDMVLSLRHGTHDHRNLPAYQWDAANGLYVQDEDPHFPASTFDPHEQLDPTFYTRSPQTSARMDPIIARQGGGGVVVSLHECLKRYGETRQLLASAVELPTDPRRLREWSLVMAVTGTLNAVDRGLLPDSDDVLIHGSGSYTDQDYRPMPDAHRRPADTVDELAGHIEESIRAVSAH